MRRANALVAHFRQVLYEGQSVLLYNLLMKGYIKSNFPLGALTVKDEILRQGLKPDRLTYNTIIFACVKSEEIEKAFQFLKDMKEEAKRDGNPELLPDAVTYTTLLKGLGNSQDLYAVLKIVVEMKSSLTLIDRTAYTAMADAFLACGSIDGKLYSMFLVGQFAW
ncbi:pentatricopeptide repeat-containing protein At5g10690-like isoform X1 [Lolium perenne]|uniref:pentatricopeptide repeat-containing protein At5g10690-like isoform X1 n=1 Tax=Lolium perenne TaxID=4522 RepID=UPI0021F63B1A|nr:pentatricopeptide repeat-containing protein At5g10690-like isoform X1 [Lolium perenne]